MSKKSKAIDKAEEDIAIQVAKAYAALKAAEKLAIEHGLDFSFRPAYGMGGWFVGTTDEDNSSAPGWQASSHNC